MHTYRAPQLTNNRKGGGGAYLAAWGQTYGNLQDHRWQWQVPEVPGAPGPGRPGGGGGGVLCQCFPQPAAQLAAGAGDVAAPSCPRDRSDVAGMSNWELGQILLAL
jgi:hypothetical protein